MKKAGRGFGLVVGILLGIVLNIAGAAQGDVLLMVVILVAAALVGYLGDAVLYVFFGSYPVDRRLNEVTRH